MNHRRFRRAVPLHSVLHIVPLALALLAQTACLVVSVQPVYNGETLMWDPALLGRWEDTEDRATLSIEAGEWKSYRIRYTYPIESGELTGFLTAVGDTRYLDVMPASGQDPGSFLLPLHLVVRVTVAAGRLELAPLSYDWFDDRLRTGRGVPGLRVVRDQKDNALLVSSTAALRAWLRTPVAARALGAAAVFDRKD